MKTRTKIIVSFLFGAAVGAASTYKIFKERFKKIADEEIESIKNAYSNNSIKKENDNKNNTTLTPPADISPEKIAYMKERLAKEKEEKEDAMLKYWKKINDLNYSSDEDEPTLPPYVINPEDFGDIREYASLTLIYYADGVLCDEDDNIVEDINIKVGSDFASHFGEFEDDSVYVQNDNLRCYYEILASAKLYTEIDKGGIRCFDRD